MKFFTVLALAGAATATVVPAVSTGNSAVSSQTDGVGNYAFGYNEDHATGGTFRKEQGGPGFMSGSYGLRDADGRQRVVNYVADALGYRASISTNEPGTDVKQDPNNADFNLGAAHALVAAPAVAAVQHVAAPVANVYAQKVISAPVVAATQYSSAVQHVAAAAPVVAHVAAPVVAHVAAPVATSYSTAVHHAAPAVYAAPKVMAAPAVYAAPVATSYSTAVHHAAPAVLSAPVVAAKTFGIASPITGFSSGFYPAVHGYAGYASPVMASKSISSFGKIY